MKFVTSMQAEISHPMRQVAGPLRGEVTASVHHGGYSRWAKPTHVVAALLVGTGGVATPGYVAERGDRGYRLPGIEYSNLRGHFQKVAARTAAQNLSRVREIFAPSVTELAALFGVSRQAIYNWQAGQPITDENKT